MTGHAKKIAAAGLLAMVLSASSARAQSGTVETVEVQGLVRMTREAFLHAFSIRAGDPYDRARIQDEFRKLWKMGLFSDIVVEAEDGPRGGKVLVVKVKERPHLASVTFEDNKILTRTQIEDRLKERKVSLDLGKPLNMKSVFDAESVIRDYLGEKGYLDGKVNHTVDAPTETSSAVRFTIRPGGKTRIRKIDFVGNKVYSDAKLMRQLKLTRPWRWYWPWTDKNLYHPVKWEQDVQGVVDLYLNSGYLNVEVRPPVVEVKEIVPRAKGRAKPPAPSGTAPAEAVKTSPGAAAPRAPAADPKAARKELRRAERERKRAEKELQNADARIKRWVHLTVPINEGESYRLGEVTFSGNTVFGGKELRTFIPVRKGDVVNQSLLKLGTDAISRAYGDRGYLYANVVRQIRRDAEERVADVEIVVTEDRPYYVGRIEFAGNTSTRDEVLRREFALKEGDLFSRSRLDLSLNKINQLGYFEAKEQPVIEPVEGEGRVRITVQGEEKSRSQIQIGGGYSGADGAFFTGYYSTQNFLGRGQILAVSLQLGGRRNLYSISFLEPWFLNRPYQLGFNVFRRDTDYGGSLRSSGRGGGITLGRQIGYFSRLQLKYDYENIETTGFTVSSRNTSNRISSLTPAFSYYKIDNPYRPSRGWSLAAEMQVAGGFLGGNTSFLRPILSYTGYKRVWRRTFMAFHAEAGLVRSWGDARANNTTASYEGTPLYQRFWIGGEQGPRVFDIRSVTPLRFVKLDPYGRVVDAVRDPRGLAVADYDRNGDGILNQGDLVELGGDRYYLFQAEYVVPVGGPVEAAWFLDAGNSLFEDAPWGTRDLRLSTGIELRFYLPVFPVPLRLIYGWPIRSLAGDRTSSFTFSIGRSF